MNSIVGSTPKPKDDETIVKNVVRRLVIKVARRLTPKNARRNRNQPKEAGTGTNENQEQDNNENREVGQNESRPPRRGRGRRGGRPGNNGYFMDPGKIESYFLRINNHSLEKNICSIH